MDFFEQQAQAQSKTQWLIVYFALAVLGIIAALQFAFSLLIGRSFLDWELLGWVSGGVVLTVFIGSAVKMVELSKGGRVVAAMLGGEPVTPNTVDLNEQKLLNVVEEMALASGVPVPEVYVLPDQSINAFAAGHGPGDTAIGVTRGCIEKLTRDELQGVIAHEFSHILHGDMKLNVRLIGLLNGILCLAFVGGFLLRFSIFAPSGAGDRDNRRGGGLVFAMMAGGLALFIIGWIGVFFGNLIKAAVSRQREFLADASAVQFTRNPSGIAGALWKIGRFASRLESPRAQEASHMFFGNGVEKSWMSFFATHPPLDERIKAIDAHFDPSQLTIVEPPPPPRHEEPAAGGLPQSLGRVQAILAALPGFAGETVRDLHGACAYIYAMLLDERDDFRRDQLVGFKVDDAMRTETLALFARRGEIRPEQRLPLIDLIVPTLRNLSRDQYSAFRANVRYLMESDRQIHLFEYALQKTLLRHLELFFTRSTGPKIKYRVILPLLPDVAALLTGLAVVGNADVNQRDTAFAAGVRELLVKTSPDVMKRGERCDLAAIDAGLDRIACATPDVKRVILKACRCTVANDGVLEQSEYELLRAIADTLDCPMPPLPPART